MGRLFFKFFTSVHVFLYRLTGGKFGGKVQGLDVLLLTTTGRKTGKQRTTPLGFFKDDGDYVIIASNAGFDRHPDWFHNLNSNTDVAIEIQGKQINVKAKVAGPDKRSRLWEQLVARAPGYRSYKIRTDREIPVVLLQPH